MIPPWRKYPSFDRGSMGWRMGAGEGHYNEFYKWFSRLSEGEVEDYSKKNPEPESWKGFYQKIRKNPWL